MSRCTSFAVGLAALSADTFRIHLRIWTCGARADIRERCAPGTAADRGKRQGIHSATHRLDTRKKAARRFDAVAHGQLERFLHDYELEGRVVDTSRAPAGGARKPERDGQQGSSRVAMARGGRKEGRKTGDFWQRVGASSQLLATPRRVFALHAKGAYPRVLS